MQLPQGSYRLIGRSPQYQDGDVDCQTDDEVVVHEADFGDVLVACHMR